MKLFHFAFSFGFGTLISRILGFLRDAGIAYFFGASHTSDAFFVAFRIPNSLRRLLGEGGFNAAFVPLYTKALEEGKGDVFLGRVLLLYVFVNTLITALGVVLSEYIISMVAPGLRSSESFSLAVFMARFLFLYLILIGVNALFMGALNVKGRFFIPAFSQGVFNGMFLLVLMLSADKWGYISLIAGVLAGGVLQVMVNIPALASSGVRFKLSFGIDEQVKLLAKRLVPALGGFGVNQLSLFIDTFLASFLKTGAISYLYFANRLYQLPFGIVSVGVANSLLSLLSKKDVNAGRELTLAFKLVIMFTLPASVGLILLSEEIVRLIYGRGSFSSQDVQITAEVLSLYSLGLVMFSLQKVLSAEFFARGDTKTPVKVSLYTILSEGVMAGVLAFGLGLGVFGLPLGTALSSLVGFSILLRWSKTDISWGEVGATLLRVLISSLLMGIVVYGIKMLFDRDLVVVSVSISTAIAVYFTLLILFKEELSLSFLKSLVKKLGNP